MTLIKLVTVECVHLDEFMQYNLHSSLLDKELRHKFLDSIISTIINNILRELYHEPIDMTISNIVETYEELGLLVTSNIDLHSALSIMYKIKNEIISIVISECTIANTTTYIDVIANRFLNIFIYDISPIPNLVN